MKKIQLILLALIIVSCQKEKNKVQIQINKQEDVLSEKRIDSILDQLETVTYENLPEQYIKYSHPECKFNNELSNRKFYKLNGNQLKLKVVGEFTIQEFLAKDEYYKTYKRNPFPEFEQYWLVDKEVLYMMLELISQLKKEGYNEYGFHIRTAHRHPTKNGELNGASYSQHMFGKAIDIGIDDINQDGKSTQADKTIVYNMLEKIVGNEGGLGKYPGTMNLHFDCRGFKARWDVP
ncbi:MAG: D-Ala-D-Ala carboxypeptidase family metallohydrolase [Crocinitomicaceae bacterium]